MEEITIEDFSTDELLDEIGRRDVLNPIKIIKSILSLKSWHDKERVILEIKNLP